MHLTVGIATWNRSDLLRQTLEALAAVRVPDGVTAEVIVADNNSTDDTPQTVEAAQATFTGPLHLQHLFEPTQGKSHALNRLLDAATGQWLLLLDDDVRVDPGWLAAYVEGMQRYPDATCLGGPIEPWLHGDLTARGRLLLEAFPAAYGVLRVPQDTPMALPDTTAYGANMALRRDAIPDEGFDTHRGMLGGVRVAGEDMAIQLRMLEAGGAGWLLADAVVRHYTEADRVNTRWFWKWQKAIGAAWLGRRGSAREGGGRIPLWHWRELARRGARAALRWRPWPTRAYYDALVQVAQYWGWIEVSRRRLRT